MAQGYASILRLVLTMRVASMLQSELEKIGRIVSLEKLASDLTEYLLTLTAMRGQLHPTHTSGNHGIKVVRTPYGNRSQMLKLTRMPSGYKSMQKGEKQMNRRGGVFMIF